MDNSGTLRESRCMLVLPGSSALSAFRKQRLLVAIERALRATGALAQVDFSARLVHVARVHRDLDVTERARLEALLEYGPRERVFADSGRVAVVAPRPGTQSPWSSKATDIARVCGLEALQRIERVTAFYFRSVDDLPEEAWQALVGCIHDRMTQTVFSSLDDCSALFEEEAPRPLGQVELGDDPVAALARANQELGLALSPGELKYLAKSFAELQRNPTDVELMMFAQMNSEHCRHKIFKADWVVDGKPASRSLFQMIQNTFTASPLGVLSAYHDNAAVMRGYASARFWPDALGHYQRVFEDAPVLMKVETHNHPTAISPFPGAATGSGGEIRDEGATGRGSKPKAGLSGFSVSNLKLPDATRPWEVDYGKPEHIQSALAIMLEGPIGAAAFNNEFGRPNICGYFRSFELKDGEEVRGYHKPIMLAGGLGTIRPMLVDKRKFDAGTLLVVLGGPAMLIGLGGGAASSMAQGQSSAALDFASVQRGNPEMQRRCQEVINRCCALGDESPIESIHDVGAGGLSNALPELVNDAGRGAVLRLRDIPSAEPGLSPLELWCNEAQERYVLAIAPDKLAIFEGYCAAERAPFAVVGQVTAETSLTLEDSVLGSRPIDMPLPVLLGNPPKTVRQFERQERVRAELDLSGISLQDAVERVLLLPTVADKTFLVTIGDRSVTGLVTRDQMVGPWQVPVADCGITLTDYDGFTGEAMAMGERTPVALIDAAAAARMAVGEAITNLCSAPIAGLSELKLSANWMAAAGYEGEDQALFDAVHAVGQELCPALGIAIPVGKDSMSMRTRWRSGGEEKSVAAPLSLIVSAFARSYDVRNALTPVLVQDVESQVFLLDLGRQRMGGSALAQVYGKVGCQAPDVDSPQLLSRFFSFVQVLIREQLVLAYHDRSDGGLFVTLAEMAFAGHSGLDVSLDALPEAEPLVSLFNEELGGVIQVRDSDVARVEVLLREYELEAYRFFLGRPKPGSTLVVRAGGEVIYERALSELRRLWSDTTYRMQALRDDPECAREELECNCDFETPGLTPQVTFKLAPFGPVRAERPRVAILREQGVNGHVEMAAAFDRAGFDAVDVHMTELLAGSRSLTEFSGLAACGGFSYGDVLGAGGGWAKSILFHAGVRAEFAAFFERADTFTLGVCNGCQMLSGLRAIIPGTEHWPRFLTNRSEQFEARLSLVEVMPSASVLLQGMAGSRLPVAVAHGEGRVEFDAGVDMSSTDPCLRFIEADGRSAVRYPHNPNGSPGGLTGLCSQDGRVTIMMPHPERVVRSVCLSWAPPDWEEESPWMQLFHNARRFVG